MWRKHLESSGTQKNKEYFIKVTGRYMPCAVGSNKSNYVVQVKHFETETTEDALHWYKTLQEILEPNLYEDVETKFGTVDILLGGQGNQDFMRFKKIVTKC